MSHKKYRTENNCLNCGAIVERKFCPECGQENIETHENFFHMVAHTVGDFFHYDSKFLRTLKPLFLKPGFLTVQYWEGKRTSYVHPLRLFFFITIVMVIIGNAYYHKFEQEIQREKIVSSSTSNPDSEEEVKQSKAVEERLRTALNRTFDYIAIYLKYISFILMPLYALVFKILFIRRKKFYVDHLIYTMHVQSFVYILISLLLLIPLFITPSARSWWGDVTAIATGIYVLISLKRIYQQSWGKTILKSIIATLYIFLTTVFFLAGFMAIMFIITE